MNKFSPHLKLAQTYWKNFLQKKHIVIDATCGNGYDSLFLSQILTDGKLYCFDIQEKAIKTTYQLLKENLIPKNFKNIILLQKSHEDFSKYVNSEVNLIVYNLGYLPNSDKVVKTKVETTIKSIKSAFSLLAKKGAISIVSYPGHKEGAEEEKALISFFQTINYFEYNICYHKWLNKEKAPSFFWIEKK